MTYTSILYCSVKNNYRCICHFLVDKKANFYINNYQKKRVKEKYRKKLINKGKNKW